MTKKKMKKILDEIGALCTCDYKKYKDVYEILSGYGLMYRCKDCKHFKKDCDFHKEWNCTKDFPPSQFKKKVNIFKGDKVSKQQKKDLEMMYLGC